MYSNALPAALLFVAILVYFPSAPALPPSLSSTMVRMDFIAGFKEVMRSKASWMIAIGCSVPQVGSLTILSVSPHLQGVVIAWTAMMVVNLTEICVGSECLTQNWVNYLGIWATVVSTIAAILVARAADSIKGKLKEVGEVTMVPMLGSHYPSGVGRPAAPGICGFLAPEPHFYRCHPVQLTCGSSGNTAVSTQMSSQVSVYILLLLGNSLVVSSMPIAMELAMELCYPAAEGVVSSISCFMLPRSEAGSPSGSTSPQ